MQAKWREYLTPTIEEKLADTDATFTELVERAKLDQELEAIKTIEKDLDR